jgi:hypothetical protein
MSMVICDACEDPIDSDHDPACFIEEPWGTPIGILCENCRESAAQLYQEGLMETGGGPTLQEQQQAAYRIKHGIRG